jgi:formate hydrogenlyase transcriptional activator
VSIVTCEGDKILSIVRDISGRRLAEEALRESESRLRLAQQAARVGTWEWDLRTGVSVWSDMIWELLGLEPGDGATTVEKFVEFIHPEDRDRVWRKVSAVIAEREEYYDEFRLVQRDGRVLWVSSKGRLFRSASGQPERMIGVNIDITERKVAEEALKSALDEVRQLKDRLHEENIYLQEEIRVASDFGEIIGGSEVLRKVLRQAEKVAPTGTTVLILGETGTGKELLAHAIHNHSPRRKHPLVKVNCAALPGPLIESELFGHEKGAFTGADTRRMGRFALADGGSIFLDEVGELPLDLQAKLLRVLEEGEFELVGGSRTVSVDVRIIAATNRDLSKAVAEGTFRSDLFYRLSIFPITMPPLRERREDIRMLVTHLVKQLSVKLGKQIDSIPQSVINVLQNYDWPGNIRELKNVIERAIIITQGPKLQLIDSLDPLMFKTEPGDFPPDPVAEIETLEQSEYHLILRTLKKVHWRVEGPGGAAELLGVNASTLRSRMKKLRISRPKVQASGSSS